MDRKQLIVGIGVLFIILIVFLQTISRDNVEKENFEPNRVFIDKEIEKDEDEYEKMIEELEKEEALNEEKEFEKIYYQEDDQLLDRGRRFMEENQDTLKRWKDPSLSGVPNVNARPTLELQNPIEAAKLNKDNIKSDANYAKDRLSELMKYANQVNQDQLSNSLNQQSGVTTDNSKDSSATVQFGGRHITDNCYIPKGRTTCGPQYIISGAMKCGTTSMYAYLTSHPKVLPLNPTAKLNGKPILANKEVRFWLDPTYSSMVKSKGDDKSFYEYLDLFYPIGVSDPYFHSSNMQYVDYITGEASPMYICQFGVAQRIYNHLPDVKIIIMLRNPIDRAYSELWFKDSLTKGKTQDIDFKIAKQRYQTCLEYEADLLAACDVSEYTSPTSVRLPQDLNVCVTSLHNLVRGNKCDLPNQWLCSKYQAIGSCAVNNLKNSLYALQLREWVEYFGTRDQLLIIKSEDFYKETSHWMQITSKFLGIDDGSEDFNWDSVTGNAFNIINPGTVSANGMDIASTGSAGGLKMGSTSAENVSQYPDIDDDIRLKLSEFFDPLNRDLSKLIGQPLFWNTNSQKGD